MAVDSREAVRSSSVRRMVATSPRVPPRRSAPPPASPPRPRRLGSGRAPCARSAGRRSRWRRARSGDRRGRSGRSPRHGRGDDPGSHGAEPPLQEPGARPDGTVVMAGRSAVSIAMTTGPPGPLRDVPPRRCRWPRARGRAFRRSRRPRRTRAARRRSPPAAPLDIFRRPARAPRVASASFGGRRSASVGPIRCRPGGDVERWRRHLRVRLLRSGEAGGHRHRGSHDNRPGARRAGIPHGGPRMAFAAEASPASTAAGARARFRRRARSLGARSRGRPCGAAAGRDAGGDLAVGGPPRSP